MIDDAPPVEHRERVGDLPRIVTTPQQALSGLHIGLANLCVQCSTCDRPLQAGDLVWVYAHRAADEPEWQLTRCYCRGCAAHAPDTQTLGTSELLAKARLNVVTLESKERRQLCLSDVTVCKYSPLEASASP